MRKYILILLLFIPLGSFAQQDAYYDGFCKAFEELSSFFNTYRAASSGSNSDEAFYGFSGVTQQYHTLLKIYDEVSFKYRHDAIFDAIFRREYLEVIEEADLLLEADVPLRLLKDMVRTMVHIEREGFPHTDREVENSMRMLRFALTYRPEFFSSTLEGMLLKKQIAGLDAYIFRKYFDRTIASLTTEPVTDSLRAQARRFKVLAETSSCVPCRDRAFTALLNFHRRAGESR
jgi:hypothetical protein